MKIKLSKALSVAFLCALASPFTLARETRVGDTRVDLSTRRAVYVSSSKIAIDLKNDKYVAADGTITVNRHQAESCQGNKCIFNLGIIAIKSGGSGALDAYGQYAGPTFGMVGNTIVFSASETTKQQVLPVSLAIGKNIVTFTIDPQKKIAETDETNNTMTVTIIVE